jgi:hypothetical protein
MGGLTMSDVRAVCSAGKATAVALIIVSGALATKTNLRRRRPAIRD